VNTANLIMLGIGLFALALGLAILFRRGGSDQARVARRMVGTMVAALGLILTLFAFGLSGVPRIPGNA
jgi:hypothetical protein